MSLHREVVTKVNALVDAGIVPLVAALNFHGCLLTVDSCQGGNGDLAYVWFTCRDIRRLPDVVDTIARFLGGSEVVGCGYNLSVEWFGSTKPMAKIQCDTEDVATIARAITNLTFEPEDA